MTSGPSRADELSGLVCLESNRIRLMRPYDLSQHAKDVINERDNQLSWLEQVLEWPELVEADADDPQVTHYVGRIAEYRTPPRAQLDLQLSYDFYILLRQHISLVFYVNNIFNDRTPYQLNENDANSGTFGQVGARYGALSFRLGARYDF